MKGKTNEEIFLALCAGVVTYCRSDNPNHYGLLNQTKSVSITTMLKSAHNAFGYQTFYTYTSSAANCGPGQSHTAFFKKTHDNNKICMTHSDTYTNHYIH